MWRTEYPPLWQQMFRQFMACGFGGRQYYTRKERIEYLERMKQALQREIEGIDERIADLKKQQAS